eukprot:scaffold106457_cov28-Tisochrysis_lutea.AAC.2
MLVLPLPRTPLRSSWQIEQRAASGGCACQMLVMLLGSDMGWLHGLSAPSICSASSLLARRA